jgi:hypothetical protein
MLAALFPNTQYCEGCNKNAIEGKTRRVKDSTDTRITTRPSPLFIQRAENTDVMKSLKDDSVDNAMITVCLLLRLCFLPTVLWLCGVVVCVE